MKFEDLKILLDNTEDFKKAVEAITKTKPDSKVEEYLKQYNVENHDVLDDAIRKKKPIEDESGKVIRYEEVNRIGIPMQQIIASRAAAFLCANPIQLNATPNGDVEKKLLSAINKVWDDNKLDYESMDIAEIIMSETECAELWFAEEADPDYWKEIGITSRIKPRMLLLSPSKGDDLYPVKDFSGNMIAFGRKYTLKNNGQDEVHFDIYTDKVFYKSVQQGSDWVATTENNPVGKIPVVYHQHPKGKPEWSNVQTSIGRLETKVSNHGDTNDYYDSPILFIEGDIEGMSVKGDSGKMINATNGAKASYLTWDHAPESTKMEIDTLFRIIYSCTDTPDISFDNLKGLGTTSGFALEMMFMGAHLKAARHAGPFGKSIQRRINYIAAVLASTDTSLKPALKMVIKPKFEFYMPKDIEGMVNTLTTAVTGKILSKRTAISNLPGLVSDTEAELKQIQEEENSAQAGDDEINDQP